MSGLDQAARLLGWSSIGIGCLQALGGAQVEAGMGRSVDATVDSHVRFMGMMFVGYGLACLDAAARHDGAQARALAWLMGAGGASRLMTRLGRGRPHRVHDALLVVELATPIMMEAISRGERQN